MEEKKYLQVALDFAWNYGPNIVISIAMLIGGLWVIRRVSNVFASFLRARSVDESLRPFFGSLIDVAMKVALLLVIAGRMGIETTSFIAIFSALAFAIGFALQGSLGNFASGVLILLFRPYKVGDMLTVAGLMGDVREIQIFNTILITPQGKRIIIPNGKMTEGAIENITSEGAVRTDVVIHVRDNTSMRTLREASEAAVHHCPFRTADSKPFVEVSGFPRDSIQITIGCWTTGAHYWETFFFMNERLKYEYDLVGIKLAKFDEA